MRTKAVVQIELRAVPRQRDVLAALDACRERAATYLRAQVHAGAQEQWWRHSPTHDVAAYPSHLLYGTWAGVLATVLLGQHRGFDADTMARIGRALGHFQQSDGAFAMRVPVSQRGDHDEEYLALHCTNYAVGALRALGISPAQRLAFTDRLATPASLTNWLAGRDLTRPWREGNNIVNLASFYAVLAEDGHVWARERLEELADWHDAHQNRETGFWHTDNGMHRAGLLSAVAGGAHNLHLYYYLDRPVPRANRIIDSCLRLGYLGVDSACVDIDVVDILSHLRWIGHRVREIDSVLERYLLELLPLQNADGGFGDNYVTPQTTYGLVTPLGVSTTWTTYFRLATLGMVACTLLPDQGEHWAFRNTIGMGYFKPQLLRERAGRSLPTAAPRLSRTLQRWLAIQRSMRFTRQRVTSRIRRWLVPRVRSWR